MSKTATQASDPPRRVGLSTREKHRLQISRKPELYIVVGTEQYYNTYGLKMMFFAPAVRDIRKYGEDYQSIALTYFDIGYNSAEIDAVKESLEGLDVKYAAVTTVSELITDINTRAHAGTGIMRMNIYAHGFPQGIEFRLGDDGDANQAKGRLGSGSVLGIDRTAFRKGAVLWSYACRTGNGVLDPNASLMGRILHFQGDFEVGPTFTSDAGAKPEESLAQVLADHLGIEVYAWLTRTLFEAIWNDEGDEGYRSKFTDIKHEGLDGGLSRELKSLIPFRGAEDKDDLALWNSAGARNEVSGASTPEGLSNGVYRFVRQALPALAHPAASTDDMSSTTNRP